jgi:hypothetical protein
MASRIGGTLFIAVNGVRLAVVGDWEVGFGQPKREMKAGADGVHGYTEMPQVPYIAGEATALPATDVPALLNVRDAVVTAELANGQVPVLRDAVQTGEGVYKTESGNLALRFEGTSMECPPAA